MMPIEKATAISFVVPFIVTILAVLFLGEKFTSISFALVLGFIGMLVILRPGIDISMGVYMALASSFMVNSNYNTKLSQKMIAQLQFYLMDTVI